MSSYWKKKLEELEKNETRGRVTSSSSSTQSNYWEKKLEELKEEERRVSASLTTSRPSYTATKDEDIAPVSLYKTNAKTLTETKDEKGNTVYTYSKDDISNPIDNVVSQATKNGNLDYAQKNFVSTYTPLLAGKQMTGQKHSVLEELQAVSAMKDGEEKDKRKEALLKEIKTIISDHKKQTLLQPLDDGWQMGDVTSIAMEGLNRLLTVDELNEKDLYSFLANETRDADLFDLTWNSATRGYNNALYGEESFKAMNGGENEKAVYEQILKGDTYNFNTNGALETGVSGAFEQVGQWFRQYTNPRTLAIAGGAAGAAAIAGQLGPQVAAPEEIVTVPGAFAAGLASGNAASALEIEAGLAYNEMLEAGVSESTAQKIALGVGTVNAGLEFLQIDELLDAYKITKASGATKSFTKRILDELIERGIDVATETGQEVLQEGATIAGVQAGSKIDTGEWAYSASDVGNRLLDTAKSSALSFGVMNVPAAGKNITSMATDNYQANKLTADEKTVVDTVVEEHIAEQEKAGKKMTAKEKSDYRKSVEDRMKRGYVTAEEIEKVLGGEDYANFKAEEDKMKATDDFKAYAEASADEKSLADLKKQYDELYKMPNGQKSDEQRDQQADLKRRIEAVESLSELQTKIAPEVNRIRGVRDQMRSKVQDRVKGTFLEESYKELARRNEKPNIDVNKYTNETAKKTVQGIVDSELGDGTNEFADKVDFLANLSAKTGRVYKLMTEQQLKDAGYWEDGKETHGLTDEDGNVLLNYDSSRNLHWTIGHETGHVIEKAGQSKALQQALFNHAIAKEGVEAFNKRLKAKEADYKGKTNTTPEAELANDLLGEYIFSDYEFVSNLAKTNRTVFDKAFDAIKHFYKMATAGSYQQRELEKAKYLFQKALEEVGEGNNSADGAKFSLENGKKSKYNKGKKSWYSQHETEFMIWSNSSARAGEVKRFVRNGKVRYYEKTENGCVELSWTQFNERNNEYVENFDRRAERRLGTTADFDENPQSGSARNSDSYSDTGRNASAFGQVIRERFSDDNAGSASGGNGYDSRTGINQYKYDDEASDYTGASITFSNDYQAIRNYIKEGDTGEETDAPVKFSVSKSENIGYHAGDLGKSEALWHQGLSRDTGHFGTGTYFVGNEAALEGYNKRDGKAAPVETVAFDKYNLFAPQSEEDGFALHDFLRGVDGYWNRDADAVNTMDEYEQMQAALNELTYEIEYFDFGESDPSDAEWISKEQEFLATAKRMMGNYSVGTTLTETLRNLTGENYQYDYNENEYYTYDFETSKFTHYEELDILKRLNEDRGGWRAFEKIEKEADTYYNRSNTIKYENWNKSLDNIANILGMTKDEILSTLQGVGDEINSANYSYEDELKADSAATRFMKALGYEGIDVRGLKALDNTMYGSVIYDLKGEDLARKKEIGTAKFSLSSTVEETKDLVALHNLTAEKLLKSLELGGLPMPSIAVTKADIPHDNFGEITLIMGKDTIDPKKNKKNVVYSADAWTPTFPRVEYEADDNVERQINKKLLDLATKVDDVFKHDLDMLRYGHEDNLNRHGGEEGYIQYVMDKYGVKAAYLEDQGKHVEKITEQVLEDKKYNTANEAKYQAIVDILGVSSASELGKLNLKETAEQYGEQLEDIYPGITKTAMRMSSLFRQVMAYMDDKGGEPVYRTVTDESAMRKAIDDAIDMEGFEAWTRNLFSGIVKDKGIYNNKDLFTPSGNRKSFKQTHLPFTLENIVKAMASQNGGNTKNVSGFNGIKTLRAGTAERFKSIEAMHQRKDRLQHLTQGEADKINDDLSARLYAIMEAVDNENGGKGDRNSFIRFDAIGETLMEISESGKYNVADIQRVFAQYSKNISDDLAADIKQLLFDVTQMPVNIYEAKPERAVTFDEVGVFVIPRNADIKLKQELLNRGYSIAEYDPDVEGDRNKVVNQFEEYKFSLSDAGKDVSTERGVFNERWSDFGRKDVLDDIAPVREDIAPVKEAAAPVADSYSQLVDRLEETENLLRAAMDVGDVEAIRQYTEEYEAIRKQVEEYEADDAERFNSLNDEDAPPERTIAPVDSVDTITLGKNDLTDIAASVRDQLGLSSRDMYDVHKLIEKYAQDEFASREDLFDAIKERFGTYVESEGVDESIKEAKKYLRTYGLYVDDIIQGEIADFADLRRRNRGKVRFSRNGTPVDVLYHELNSLYPGLFPDSILAPTDMFLQMIDVANMDSRVTTERQHDSSVLKGVADDIADYVDDIRYTQRENGAGISSESFDDLVKNADRYIPADDIAPVATEPVVDDIAPIAEDVKVTEKTAPAKVSKAVESKLDTKIANTQAELDKNRQLREQSAKDYDEEIARLQAKYDALKNKNTLAANDILRSIERKKRLKANNDAGYAKRISDLEARVEKMSSPEYRTAEHRRTKMEEYTEMWKNLIGDTSTWKDLALGISYKTKTMRRFLRQVVKGADGKPNYKLADQIYDELETKYDHNEALLKRESQKQKEVFQKLNLNHAEDTYAHMLGEFRYNPQTTLTEEVVKEYYEKHKNKIDTNKVDTAITEARKTFDELLVRVNTVLREQGMKEIPFRQGYFPHFTNPKQGWLAKILNWKPVNNEIPTDIAGLTEQFDPQRSWQGFNKQRKGDATDYSLYQGLDTYIHGALDWIYHIEDLQKRRSLENYIRYIHSEEGVKAKIEEIKANEYYDADEAQAQIDAVLAEAKNPLGNLVTELRARTNTLANKKASMDRGIDEATNRKIYSVMTNLNNRINANMVVGSFSSALTNFIPMVQSWHQVSPWFTARGLGDMVRNAIKDDGMVAKSDFLTNRLIEEEKLYQTGWDKVSDKAAFMMNVIDNITSQTVWRSKYLQNIKEGMSEAQAIKDADQFAKNLMAGRSRGNSPSIFDAKNPLTKIFTAFQLEVANQYGYMFEDVPQDSKSPLRLVKGYAMATLGAYAYNALYSSLVGRDAAFDPMSIIEDLLRDLGIGGDDDEEEKDVGDALLGLGENIVQEVPFVGSLFGGGRVPMSSAIPYNGDVVSAVEDAIDGEFQFKELLKPLYYLAMPVGGGQLKKTVEGLGMFSDGLPVTGSYTDSGKLRFPVEDTFGNKVQAALFGQYASENARFYFDNDIAPLGEKQIQEYQDVDIPIKDYWEYRKGISARETTDEKLEYIGSLDLPINKKNVLANNAANRKNWFSMADWDKYGGLEEFDFARENPEKYNFLKENGISVEMYNKFDEDTKDAWTWAFKNPEKYAVSKVVASDLMEYRKYSNRLNNIRADKDANGKTISGSAKNKKLEYINGLNIDYGAKLILYKSAYSSDDTFNMEIVEYLNSRNDLTYEDRAAILKELGFTVLDNGTVQWD